MKQALHLLRSDLTVLMRDHFLAAVAAVTAILLTVFAIAGLYQDRLGLTGLQPWVQYVLTLFLITNTGTYGMLFGLIFVEEVETKARAALMVMPIPPQKQILIRSLSVVIWLIIQPFLFVSLVAATWHAVPFGPQIWIAICLALSPLGAVFMIVLSTVSANRVEALAMGKFFSVATAPPILLYLLPDGAWYEHLFLIFPTTPIVHAMDAFIAGLDLVGLAWLGLGLLYSGGLVVLATRQFVRSSFKIHA